MSGGSSSRTLRGSVIAATKTASIIPIEFLSFYLIFRREIRIMSGIRVNDGNLQGRDGAILAKRDLPV